MKVVISRQYKSCETQGGLFIFEGYNLIFRCVTLELAENGNQKNVSCIPEGEYQVTKETNEKRGDHFRVHNVPDRDGILIHRGNFLRDTHGCIIPGESFIDIDEDLIIDVNESTRTIEKLYKLLPDEFKLIII